MIVIWDSYGIAFLLNDLNVSTPLLRNPLAFVLCSILAPEMLLWLQRRSKALRNPAICANQLILPRSRLTHNGPTNGVWAMINQLSQGPPPTQSTYKGPEKFADIETADAVRRGELDMKHHAVKPCPF